MEKGFICKECHFNTSQWLGRCPECKSWNSFLSNNEFKNQPLKLSFRKACDYKECNSLASINTGFYEFDRVLSNGIVDGSVSLLSGEPGVGKSTLLAQLLGAMAIKKNENIFLYVSGEESTDQITMRFNRLNIKNKNILIINEIDFGVIKDFIKKNRPKMVAIDSIQTINISGSSHSSGSIGLVKSITEEILSVAKTFSVSFFIIGQKTKDGSVAGPKHLEHMVDTVLSFENGIVDDLKVLRVHKNRFGSIENIGLLKMREGCFSKEIYKNIPLEKKDFIGKTYGLLLESKRCQFLSIESLVIDSFSQSSKKVCLGIDVNRISLLIALLEKFLGFSLHLKDIYIKICLKKNTSLEDLDAAILATFISCLKNKKIKTTSIFMGEISLTGEFKHQTLTSELLSQLKKSGVKTIFCNSLEKIQCEEMEVIKIETLNDLNTLIA